MIVLSEVTYEESVKYDIHKMSMGKVLLLCCIPGALLRWYFKRRYKRYTQSLVDTANLNRITSKELLIEELLS